MAYDDAVRELFQTPHASFVTERKRLAGDLKAAGDKTGATKLGKLNRPPISAWAVNQLWWQAREAFDKLLATAERLRDGDLGGTAAHREALAALRQRASAILTEAGNAASEGTLRRIATTLSAIAATGNFDPDPPGALTDDRDPPGFEAAGIPGLAASVSKPAPASKEDTDDEHDDDRESKRQAGETKRQADAEAARANAEATAARRKAEEATARRTAERHRYEAALRTAVGEVERRERELERLRKAFTEAEAALAKSKEIAADLEAKLAELTDE